QAACHVAGMNVSTEVTDKLVRCLADNEPSVVREALAALGRMKNAKVIPDLLKYLGSQHREISHAASWALLQFGDKLRIPFHRIDRDDHATLLTAQLVQLEAAPSASRVLPTFPTSWPHEPRLQRLLINNYAAVQKQLSTLNADEQKHFNAVLGNTFTSLTSLLQHEQATDDIFDDFLTRFVSVEFVRQQIGTILSDNNQPRSLRSKILTTAARAKMELQPEWVASLLADLDATDIVVRREALATIAAIPSAIFQPQLTEIAASPTRPPGDRLTAIEGLMNLQRSLSADSFALLVDQAQRGGPGEAVRASRLLSSASLTAEQLINVAPILPVAGPQQLNDLVLLFKRKLAPEQASAFLTGLENARSLNSLPMIEVSEVVKSFPVELHDRANSLLDRMKAAEQEKLLKLDAVVELLKGGNAAAGREVFFSEKAKCATCHVVGSKENGELLGKRVGPDLTTIGANRSSKDLLESILFPSATIVRQYEPYTLVTNDGRSYSGLVIKDTSEEITIQQSTGDPITVLRSDIEELVPSTVSIMPKGLDEQLTSQQIADLVSWLQSLKK
ncbi:MAG: HEAT repeat domain-containing protein, partial [Planctomycetaceae bacterium]|nr:HEAT repeat domain-containing protein [Planctomycetaceae bacterium]